jgi:hypothetical protein
VLFVFARNNRPPSTVGNCSLKAADLVRTSRPETLLTAG